MRKLSEDVLVVASHNAGKVREMNDLLKPFGKTAKSARELGLPEPDETGTTFEENARIKAISAASHAGLPALADDSGLCVDALGGAPGVYTADWAERPDGSGRDFMMAMERVEAELKSAGAHEADRRTAKFVSVLCLAWPDDETVFFRGEVGGTLVWPPRGEQGFGYDPIFLPDGHSRTFGEMSADEKHGRDPDSGHDGLSHRARAFSLFARQCLS